MNRSFGGIILGTAIVVTVLLAAWLQIRTPAIIPDPPPTKPVAQWGDAFDPRGDCRFKVEGANLTIDVPGTTHDLSGEHRDVSAPRVLRPVRGDFVAQVEVVGDIRPSGERTTSYALPYHGAGLLLWQDSNTYVRLERAAILKGSQLISYVNFEQRRRGRMTHSFPMAIPASPVTLRLERHGNRVSASYSPDGQRWNPMPEMPTDLAPDTRVGVAAVNTATAPFSAHYRALSVVGQASP